MMSARLERLFDRYRCKGDPKSLAKVFDATAPALWRVALHLSRSQERAEDLLQETFLAAIERAQSFDAERPLVPWLLGLLSVQARRARREEGRRPDPERLVGGETETPDAPDTPENTAARREVAEAVRKAVAELPEPYRQVLCMHLQEDLAPIQVARRLGRSGNTVRTQIRRGLALLREGLPAGMAPALVPLAGLPRIREAVLAKATQTAAQTAAKTAVVSMLAGTKTSVLSALMGDLAMKKAVVVFVGLLLIGAGAVSLWGPFDQDLPGPRDGQEGSARDVSRQPGVSSSELPAGARQALAQKSTPDSERRAVNRNPAFAGLPEKASCRVQVVEQCTGKPVPGANVAWCVQAFGEDELTAQLYTGLETQHTRIMREGRKLVADAEGFVELPCVPWACRIHGEQADRIGSLYLTEGTRPPYRLALGPTRQVEIQVVDGSGQPVAGVPVNVVALTRDNRRTLWRGATAGKQGIAKARFQVTRTMAAGKGTLFASLHAPFDPRLRKPLPAAGSAGPVRLTLPETGGIAVAVQDANGRPLPDGCIVSIQRPHFDKDVDGLYSSVAVSLPVRKGRARFLFFPLGQEFYATARSLDPSLGRATTQGAHALFDGPTRPGQQVAITLKLNAPDPALRGRVLDEHGKPLAEALLTSKVLRAEGLAGGAPLGFGRLMKTDAEGRFTWMPGHWIHLRKATELEVELIHWRSTGTGGDPRGPRGTFVATGPLPPQGLDVGVVKLGAQPLLLSGSVRDARGNPVPQAHIILQALKPGSEGDSWEMVAEFRCQEDGNFSFSGSSSQRLRVRCRKHGYFALPYRECRPGDRDVEFVLTPWCVLNGRFLLDQGLPTEDLEAAVDHLWSHVGKDGSFKIVALRPGVHAVELRMMDRVLHRVECVSVRQGEPTTLPPIDLRGRFRVLRLQVLDKDGKPPFVIRIADASAGGELLFEESVVMKGRIAIPVPMTTQRFAVSARECRPVLVSWREKEQKVVLGAGVKVKIRWQAPVPKPGSEADTLQELAFHLEPVENGKTPVWAALWQPYPEIMPWGKASGEQELILPRPGLYRVVWRATPKGCYEPIVINRAATVEVKDQAEEQPLTVSLSPEEAQAFLARRRQK